MWRGLLILLVLLLQACATQRPPVQDKVVRSEAMPFVLNGRIAVRHDDAHHSAGLRWQHQLGSDEILLLAPLGKTAARIYRDASKAVLEDGERRYHADTTEQLMQDVLGWYLPMDDLHRWVLGLPADKTMEDLQRNAFGQVASFKHNGWEVKYLRYAGDKPDSLPTQLQLKRRDLQVKLVIDEWEWEKL